MQVNLSNIGPWGCRFFQKNNTISITLLVMALLCAGGSLANAYLGGGIQETVVYGALGGVLFLSAAYLAIEITKPWKLYFTLGAGGERTFNLCMLGLATLFVAASIGLFCMQEEMGGGLLFALAGGGMLLWRLYKSIYRTHPLYAMIESGESPSYPLHAFIEGLERDDPSLLPPYSSGILDIQDDQGRTLHEIAVKKSLHKIAEDLSQRTLQEVALNGDVEERVFKKLQRDVDNNAQEKLRLARKVQIGSADYPLHRLIDHLEEDEPHLLPPIFLPPIDNAQLFAKDPQGRTPLLIATEEIKALDKIRLPNIARCLAKQELDYWREKYPLHAAIRTVYEALCEDPDIVEEELFEEFLHLVTEESLKLKDQNGFTPQDLVQYYGLKNTLLRSADILTLD